MKAILRKGMVACAAMLMGANVMAQSFDLNKEFEGDYWPSVINQSLTKDGNPRLMVAERTSNDSYSDMDRNYYQLNKLSILNNALATEKEFTSDVSHERPSLPPDKIQVSPDYSTFPLHDTIAGKN